MEADPRTDPLIGRRLDGRYEIEGFIARGGMSTVYRATDTRLHRTVAVKVMHASLADDDEFVARFHREARSAASVDHPNAVTVMDQGDDDGVVFLVMEYVPGRTLRNLLTERTRLTPAEAIKIIEPVLDALGAAHNAGLVHRDIKPENVIIGDDGRVKVTDFGLARAVESTALTTDSSMLLGTVAYLAPEQVSRGVADARSDVYAAGVLLFELLTGAAPHVASTPLAVAYKHVNDDVPPPSSVVPGLPPVLDDVVLAATARDPDLRPADANELLALVRRARPAVLMSSGTGGTSVIDLRDAPTTVTRLPKGARPPVVAGPATKSAWGRFYDRRRRSLLTWIAVLVALLLVAGVGWWFGSGRYATTPHLVGLSPTAAQAEAAKHGLKTVVAPDQVYSEDVPAGQVADTKPKPGSHISRHGTITLIISKGQLRYTVPAVAGKTVEDARNALLASNLKLGATSSTYDDTVPKGRVVRTDPPVGSRQKPGTTVNLVVSNGPQPVDVPNVVGKKTGDAVKILTGAGFTVTQVHAFSDTVDAGKVISQDPPSGQAPKGSAVTITVSDGPQTVQVPDVLGMTRADATAALAASHLKAEVVEINGAQDDIVISQSPRSGRKVPSGSSVTIYVR